MRKAALIKCLVEDCPRGGWCRGWCKMHYTRWERHGDPGGAKPLHVKNDPKANLLLQVDTTDPDKCWVWQGRVGLAGYGYVTTSEFGDKRPRIAHRVSYRLFVGPIPEGLVLDHLCRVRRCINPAHLEPVTTAENNRRSGPYQPNRKRP